MNWSIRIQDDEAEFYKYYINSGSELEINEFLNQFSFLSKDIDVNEKSKMTLTFEEFKQSINNKFSYLKE